MLTQVLLLTLLAIGGAQSAKDSPSAHPVDGWATLVVEGEVEKILDVHTTVQDISELWDLGPERSSAVLLEIVFERSGGKARIHLQCSREADAELGPCAGLRRGERVRVWAELDPPGGSASEGDWFSSITVSSPPRVVLVERQ